MSWETKTDYCGLAIANTLICKASTMNRTGQYLEKAGKNGAIAATKAFGTIDAPSCEYTIAAEHEFDAGDIVLGKITSVDSKKYALASIHYETAADAEPVFTATAQQVESGATDANSNSFAVPAFVISPDEIAEIQMSAATLSGAGCELVRAALDASCNVKPHTVNGAPVASDVTMGHVQVALTIGQYSTTEPTVAAGTGWDVSAPLTCSDPDSDMPTWTVTLSKPLTKTIHASS